jgi:hypothetical protein
MVLFVLAIHAQPMTAAYPCALLRTFALLIAQLLLALLEFVAALIPVWLMSAV